MVELRLKKLTSNITILMFLLSIFLLVSCGGSTNDSSGGGGNNNVPETNNAPIAVAEEVMIAEFGTEIQIDGNSSYDSDGDQISYQWSFTACPENNCPVLNNALSANPSFFPELKGEYKLELIVSDYELESDPVEIAVLCEMIYPSNPDFLSLEWMHGIYGIGIGWNGLYIFDIDNDGTNEIIATASVDDDEPTSFYYILKIDKDGNYRQVWQSPYYLYGLNKVFVTDADEDGYGEIFVALSDGNLIIYNGKDMSIKRTLKIDDSLFSVIVSDIDGNSTKELIAVNREKLYVYSLETYEKLWELEGCGGTRLSVGNVDNDSALEIVVNNFLYGVFSEGNGYVIDGSAREIEWEITDGFGLIFDIGDVDKDGIEEIVGVGPYETAFLYDEVSQQVQGEITGSGYNEALAIADTNNDGSLEIIIGKRGSYGIHCYDGITLNHLWEVDYWDIDAGGATNLAVGDIDSDGDIEIINSGGHRSSGKDVLYITDANTQTPEWQSVHADGPFFADVGDLNNDGKNEILMASFQTEQSYYEGILRIFDSITHEMTWELTDLHDVDLYRGLRAVKIHDIDNDGQLEFVIAGNGFWDGIIQVYDANTLSPENKTDNIMPSGTNDYTAMEIADIDNDGEPEIVVGKGESPEIIVLDGATLEEEWRFSEIDDLTLEGVFQIQINDIDNDGHTEIMASVDNGKVWIIDGNTRQLKTSIGEKSYSFDNFDIDDDGWFEIIIGKDNGNVDVYETQTFTKTDILVSYFDSPVHSIKVFDIDKNGSLELILFNYGFLSIYDMETNRFMWCSGYLYENGYPRKNELIVEDFDGDNHTEIILGTERGLFEFEN